LELESANLIIKLLQEDANTTDDSKVVKPAKTGKSSDFKDYDILTINGSLQQITELETHLNP
jgi:hypothetical protein